MEFGIILAKFSIGKERRRLYRLYKRSQTIVLGDEVKLILEKKKRRKIRNTID
jgi:hypothetical protein